MKIFSKKLKYQTHQLKNNETKKFKENIKNTFKDVNEEDWGKLFSTKDDIFVHKENSITIYILQLLNNEKREIFFSIKDDIIPTSIFFY
jgi:hypothetical protein